MKNFKEMYNRLSTIQACDRQTNRRTDGQTSGHCIVRTRRYTYASHSKNSSQNIHYKWMHERNSRISIQACALICKCERHIFGEQAINIGFPYILHRNQGKWGIFTQAYTAQRDHSTNKHFIEIGQRLAIAQLNLQTNRETWDHNKENLQ